jgi:hypothetical protein
MAVIKPFNDNKLLYDRETHRYILNYTGVGEHVDAGQAYGSIEKQRAKMSQISRTIYNYIYYTTNEKNRDYVELKLATESTLRNVIYEAMLSQLLADVESGADSVKNQTAVNMETGNIMDRTQLMRNIISIEAEMIVTASDGRNNLLFTSDRGFRLPESRYEEFDY